MKCVIKGAKSLPEMPVDCGKTKYSVEPHIADGEYAEENEWPWMAFLHVHNAEWDLSYVCGCTVIGRRTILTAAHCVDKNYGLLPQKIVAGCNLRTDEQNCTVRTAETLEVVQHEHYEFPWNDIALVTTTEPFDFDDVHRRIQPICVPTYEPAFDYVNMTVTGWGSNKNGTIQEKLKEATVRLFITLTDV